MKLISSISCFKKLILEESETFRSFMSSQEENLTIFHKVVWKFHNSKFKTPIFFS